MSHLLVVLHLPFPSPHPHLPNCPVIKYGKKKRYKLEKKENDEVIIIIRYGLKRYIMDTLRSFKRCKMMM